MFAKLSSAIKRRTGGTESASFEVTLQFNSLSPWPATAKFKRLAVKWQRGDKVRRGGHVPLRTYKRRASCPPRAVRRSCPPSSPESRLCCGCAARPRERRSRPPVLSRPSSQPKHSGLSKPVLGADDPTARAPGGRGFHLKFDFRSTATFPLTLYKARPSLKQRAGGAARAPVHPAASHARRRRAGLRERQVREEGGAADAGGDGGPAGQQPEHGGEPPAEPGRVCGRGEGGAQAGPGLRLSHHRRLRAAHAVSHRQARPGPPPSLLFPSHALSAACAA